MPTATVDGIETYYEIQGSGSPILMCAPGGFDAVIDKWRTASAWTGIDALEALAAEHTVIVYDRRECGRSGGRVERLGWSCYTKHGKALLDHLSIQRGSWVAAWVVPWLSLSEFTIPKQPAGFCCIGRWADIAGK
jgi:pimeloyl-ACP methyl ester carboxylesterase